MTEQRDSDLQDHLIRRTYAKERAVIMSAFLPLVGNVPDGIHTGLMSAK